MLQVAFVQSSYSVQENAGTLQVCVEVTANQLAPGQTGTVFISSSDITATRESTIHVIVASCNCLHKFYWSVVVYRVQPITYAE